MSNGDPLPGFDDRAPRDRYCDLILTGGVTSAIAYPAAIFALATAYRFNSIGGSSSGAGAAALAAAAEYRRRHGSSDGFRILLERTESVAKDVRGRTGLAWLFQPGPRHKRLFDALVPGFANPQGKCTRLALGLLQGYLGSIAVGIAIALAIVALVSHYGAAQGWIAYVTSSLIGAAAAAAPAIWRDVAAMVDGDYGLCSGIERLPRAPHPPLTEWLHDLIQEVAGRQQGDPPLTFADLAAAPGSPQETLGDVSPLGAKSICLQMFTANVTHGRPYLLPHTDADPPLYFRPREMRRLFPDTVVEHMTRHATRYTGDAKLVEPAQRSRAGRFWSRPLVAPPAAPEHDDALWLLPTEHLPIVVASRMSVSFPVLFTMVPLWALDEKAAPPVFRRCLFSDGGLCSNFPIHLFDSPVPAWPTFGVSLHELPRSSKKDGVTASSGPPPEEAVTLPQDHRQGHEDRWNDFGERPDTSDRLTGFIGALLSTTKDWNDAMLARLPGVRDRIVHVGLPPGIGGLNILMSGEQIRFLAELGGEAARRLLKRFARPSGPGGMADGWNEHRWVRFNLLRTCLSETLAGLTWSAAQVRHAQPMREQIRHAIDEVPLKKDDGSQLLAAQAAALEGVLAALMQAERALTAPTAEPPYKPFPRPRLRVRPPL